MQPSIFLFGWQIDEPVTTATDLLVTAVSFLCWLRLAKTVDGGRRTVDGGIHPAFLNWMRAYFLVFGISTFFGGILGHGFLRLGDFNLMKMPGWLPGMFATAFLARASVELIRPMVAPGFTKRAIWLVWLVLGATVVAMLVRPGFNWVKVNGFLQVIGLVLPISIFTFREKKHPGSRHFLWAIGWTTLASLFFSQKISPHIWFNHVDVSHIFLAVAAWFYYRGARSFESSWREVL